MSCGLFGSVLVASPDASAGRVVSVDAPAFYVEAFIIPQYTTLTIETFWSSAGTDPVLHLLRYYGNGTYAQVAGNDNWSGVEARISFTNTSSGYQEYLLVVRAKSTGTQGLSNLLKGGALHRVAIPVGGATIAASAIDFTVGDDLRTVHVPGGSEMPALLTLVGVDFVFGVGLANGVGGASLVTLNSNWSNRFFVGTPHVRDGSQYDMPRAGATLVMANDSFDDEDEDGVGDRLEQELGLCWQKDDCTNNATGHGRDTDRDGLLDGEELWGVAGELPDGSDDLPFARWGANPLKKDVFVEVDYVTSLGGAIPDDTNPFQWLRDNPTTPVGSWSGAWVGSPEAWYDEALAPFLPGPASHLRNPDGSDGVGLHFDLGVDPILPADEAKFGAWSTGAVRAVVLDHIVDVVGPIDGVVEHYINGQLLVSFDATGLAPYQIAAFIGFSMLNHPAVTFKSFVQNPDDTGRVVFGTSVAGQHFSREVTTPPGFGNRIKLPEENAKDIYERYFDPEHVDALREGRVRYGVVTALGGGGQAAGPKFVSGLSHRAFVHELGHTLGLQHYGHPQWHYPAPECLPQYRSLMNYAKPPYRFSDTDGVLSLNPAATPEVETFGGAFDHSIFGLEPYFYTAWPNWVDWNRNGLIDPSLWRTLALSAWEQDFDNGSSCHAFTQGEQTLIGQTAVGGTDLVRSGTRLYAFWATGTQIRYKFATLGAVGNKSCTGSSNPSADPPQAPCLTWSLTYTPVILPSVGVNGATAFADGSTLFVAFRTNSGQMWVHRFAVNGNGTLSPQQDWPLPDSSTQFRTDHTPDFVALHAAGLAGTPALLYLSQYGDFRHYRWEGGTWVNRGRLLPQFGSAIYGAQAPGGLAWPDPAVAGFLAQEKRTIALLPDTQRQVRVFVLDYATGRWVNLNVAGLGKTEGKPFLAFRHLRSTNGLPLPDFPGHFMFGRMQACSNNGSCAHVHLSDLVSRTSPPAPGLGLLPVQDYLHNSWAHSPTGGAASLYSDASIDNVFGLAPRTGAKIVFYPHADASPNTNYNVGSDFRVMEDEICSAFRLHTAYPPCGTICVTD